MSRCLESCLRSLRSARVGSSRSVVAPRRVPGRVVVARFHGQATARVEDSYSSSSSSHPPESAFTTHQQPRGAAEHEYPSSESNDTSASDAAAKLAAMKENSERLAEHLNGLFAPLVFPPDLAHRALTHGSHVNAKYGSNAGLTFTGRRVLECYLNLFLTASKELKPTHNLLDISDRALNSTLLGDRLGGPWRLSKVMNWTPAVTRRELETSSDPAALMRRIGLHKVQGEAVAAVVGAIYMQYGGSVAHRVFHTRILPHIVTGRGLPSAFHEEVEALAKRMGGPQGNLLHAHGKSRFDDSPSASASASASTSSSSTSSTSSSYSSASASS